MGLAELKDLLEAPFWATIGAGVFTVFTIWWKKRVDSTKPRDEVRLNEQELYSKNEREFRTTILAELKECMAQNTALRVENTSKDKTIIDLTRQVAVLQLDQERTKQQRRVTNGSEG